MHLSQVNEIANHRITEIIYNSDGTINTNGSIGWSFDAADNLFQFLKEGETLTLTYKVQLQDNSGATNATAADTKDIVITITGTNDQPVITTLDNSLSLKGDLTEGNNSPTILTTSGTLGFTDVDINDTHQASLKEGSHLDISWKDVGGVADS